MGNKKLTWKDYFSLNNIRNFVGGYWNKFKDDNYFMSLQPHVKEQVIYRANLCKECYVNGSCLECGCKTPEMFYAAAKVDSKGRWGKIMNAADWEKFKIDNSLNPVALSTFIIENDKNEKENDTKGQVISSEERPTLSEPSGD